MGRTDEIVRERLKQGLCPICGSNVKSPSTLVVDSKFGELYVCSGHLVQGKDKLEE